MDIARFAVGCVMVFLVYKVVVSAFRSGLRPSSPPPEGWQEHYWRMRDDDRGGVR